MVSPRFIYSLYENRLQRNILKEEIPQHIGLIHDGHRRYARREKLLSYEVSYKIGMLRFKEVTRPIDQNLVWNHIKGSLSLIEDNLNFVLDLDISACSLSSMINTKSGEESIDNYKLMI